MQRQKRHQELILIGNWNLPEMFEAWSNFLVQEEAGSGR